MSGVQKPPFEAFLPATHSPSIFASKCYSSRCPNFLLPPISICAPLGFIYAVLSFKPNYAAFADLSFGVVATNVALAKSIISLNDSNSLKERSKSISTSSISSFLSDTCKRNDSISKPSTVYSSLLVMYFSIFSVYSLKICV